MQRNLDVEKRTQTVNSQGHIGNRQLGAEVRNDTTNVTPIIANIGRAAGLATIPEFDVEEDKTNIDALKQRMTQKESNKKVILENDWNSQAELVPILQGLSSDCYRYEEKSRKRRL
ncbi:uncharacterized protein [Drosophila bipectinata]|uniref:uncharacterized protein isoform X2 n=1 Tax=Drosophila bipectinata TaxID=42026 RepID=UPI0038B259E0